MLFCDCKQISLYVVDKKRFSELLICVAEELGFRVS